MLKITGHFELITNEDIVVISVLDSTLVNIEKGISKHLALKIKYVSCKLRRVEPG